MQTTKDIKFESLISTAVRGQFVLPKSRTIIWFFVKVESYLEIIPQRTVGLLHKQLL